VYPSAPPPPTESPPEVPRAARVAAVLRVALGVVAAAFVVTFLVVALLRLTYPFELEWMEGATVDHVRRVLAGKQLYVSPSLEFTPYIYTPLYYYVSAGVAELTGIGFFPLRLVSLLSSLGCLLLIFSLARRETGSRLAGLLAMGFFAATYSLTDAWWDVGRVDTLALLLLLGALALLRRPFAVWSHLLAGLLAWAAFLTKQQALLVLLPVCLMVLWQHRFRGLLFPGVLGGVFFVGNWYLDFIHGGWYSFYTTHLPQSHGVAAESISGFWTRDLLSFVPAMLLLSCGYLVVELWRGDRTRGRFYLAALLGALGASWLSRLHIGGYLNVLMPAHALVALLGAVGFGALSVRWSGPRASAWRVALYVLCLAQLGRLVYAPAKYVPTAADVAAGRQFIALLASLKGDVYVPGHGFLSSLAGKRTYAHQAALWDVARGDAGGTSKRLCWHVGKALADSRFSAVVLDRENDVWSLQGRYRKKQEVFARDDVFWPVTGHPTRPTAVYVSKKRWPIFAPRSPAGVYPAASGGY
jgi:4-amino-4-deoxy-L-arabinose transferase-like glycosyltransferase